MYLYVNCILRQGVGGGHTLHAGDDGRKILKCIRKKESGL